MDFGQPRLTDCSGEVLDINFWTIYASTVPPSNLPPIPCWRTVYGKLLTQTCVNCSTVPKVASCAQMAKRQLELTAISQ